MFENKNQNELVRFIYDVCYWPIYDAVAKHTQQFPNSLDLRYSRVRYPDSARLTSMVLQFPSNISTDGDKLLFDAVVSCVIEVSEDIYNNNMLYGSCGEITQWFVVSCTATVTDKLQYFNAPYIQNYKPDKGILLPDNRVSSNIVPIIKKEDLDREAEYFLRKYCPEALERPMPVPIENIAVEKMGLEVIHGYCLSPDFRVFGEISFANGNIFVYDEQGVRSSIDVRRGTILVDEKTFYMRSVGCVNNTIAHEAYHWHRHRLYSAVKQILSGLNVTAHRCKADITYPDEESPWTDKQRMEWQASAIAPRILMPHDQFVQKAEELYAQYNYNGGDEDSAALECIIAELASFYQVSKQSVRIRLAETGHSEAEQPMETLITKVTPQDLFCEYYENERFREIIDSGLFVFADSCLVLDDEKYVARTPDGICKLTPYAREHMPECALRFSRRRRIISRQDQSAASAHDISFFGRSSEEYALYPRYDETQNGQVLETSDQLVERKRAEFERDSAMSEVTSSSKTCWDLMFEILQKQGWDKECAKRNLEERTLLDEGVFYKAKNNRSTMPSMRTILAFACGLDLDIDTTRELLRLAGHAFSDSPEHKVLKYCVTAFKGTPIEIRNEFLTSYGFAPLGTAQRK